MAEGTTKTLATLDAQANATLPDNTQGLISPADVRNMVKDAVASVQTPFCGIHISTPAVTPIIAQSVDDATGFVKAAGTTTVFPGAVQFSHPTDNRLQFSGTLPTRIFTFIVAISMLAVANNQVLKVMMAKNGDPDDDESQATIMETTYGSGTAPATVTIAGHATMDPNDFLEIFVANKTGTSNITLDRANFTIFGVFG